MIKNLTLVVTAFLVCGCSALKQAPLVYTSKQMVGIDISAPTTESAGITASVGFKNVDAAYVPVAVSNSSDNIIADSKLIEIKDVYATYGRGDQRESGSNGTDKQQAENVKNLDETLKKKNTEESNLENANALLSLVNEAESALTTLDTLFKEYDETDAVQQDTKKTSISTINKVYARHSDTEFSDITVTNIPSIKKRLKEKYRADAEKAVKEAKEEVERASLAFNQAKEQLAKSLFESQRDAMSVFGSFDSSSSGSTNNVSVGFGKVFSTGVAAQNISKSLAVATIRASCIKVLQDVTDATLRVALMKECTSSSN